MPSVKFAKGTRWFGYTKVATANASLAATAPTTPTLLSITSVSARLGIAYLTKSLLAMHAADFCHVCLAQSISTSYKMQNLTVRHVEAQLCSLSRAHNTCSSICHCYSLLLLRSLTLLCRRSMPSVSKEPSHRAHRIFFVRCFLLATLSYFSCSFCCVPEHRARILR